MRLIDAAKATCARSVGSLLVGLIAARGPGDGESDLVRLRLEVLGVSTLAVRFDFGAGRMVVRSVGAGGDIGSNVFLGGHSVGRDSMKLSYSGLM